MDASLHSHIAAIHIQERIDRAAGERLTREVRAASKGDSRRPRLAWRRSAKPRAKVAAMRSA